ncbi:MAG: transcription elongation factor GreA [Ardenticatenales bacterium]
MVHEPQYITPEGHARLVEELRHLKEVRRSEVAEMIREAKEAGDISENAGYDEAKEKQAFVEGRIQELEDLLKHAAIIEGNGGQDTIALGSTLVVQEVDGDGEREEFRLVGSAEADPTKGLISNQSPLGKALLGKKVGDRAKITTPDGGSLTFAVVQVS